jgi:uncharacterized phage protein (TIGR01671 family)
MNNRVIKFRVKYTDSGANHWVYSDYDLSDFWYGYCDGQCDSETLSQSIGLKDKEGREIYEGDICKLDSHFHFENSVVGYVNYCVDRACYRLLSRLDTDIYQIDMRLLDEKAPLKEGVVSSTERTCKISCNKIEVIGNIWENKELLNA